MNVFDTFMINMYLTLNYGLLLLSLAVVIDCPLLVANCWLFGSQHIKRFVWSFRNVFLKAALKMYFSTEKSVLEIEIFKLAGSKVKVICQAVAWLKLFLIYPKLFGGPPYIYIYIRYLFPAPVYRFLLFCRKLQVSLHCFGMFYIPCFAFQFCWVVKNL